MSQLTFSITDHIYVAGANWAGAIDRGQLGQGERGAEEEGRISGHLPMESMFFHKQNYSLLRDLTKKCAISLGNKEPLCSMLYFRCQQE